MLFPAPFPAGAPSPAVASAETLPAPHAGPRPRETDDDVVPFAGQLEAALAKPPAEAPAAAVQDSPSVAPQATETAPVAEVLPGSEATTKLTQGLAQPAGNNLSPLPALPAFVEQAAPRNILPSPAPLVALAPGAIELLPESLLVPQGTPRIAEVSWTLPVLPPVIGEAAALVPDSAVVSASTLITKSGTLPEPLPVPEPIPATLPAPSPTSVISPIQPDVAPVALSPMPEPVGPTATVPVAPPEVSVAREVVVPLAPSLPKPELVSATGPVPPEGQGKFPFVSQGLDPLAPAPRPAVVESLFVPALPVPVKPEIVVAVPQGTVAVLPDPAPALAEANKPVESPASPVSLVIQETPARGSPQKIAETRSTPLVEQLGKSIVSRAEMISVPGRLDFHLRLEPPELGTVRVQLTLTDQSLTARLVVPDDAARQLILSQIEALRTRLVASGFNVGHFDVGGQAAGRHGRHYDDTHPWHPLSLPRGIEGNTTVSALAAQHPATGRIDVMV